MRRIEGLILSEGPGVQRGEDWRQGGLMHVRRVQGLVQGVRVVRMIVEFRFGFEIIIELRILNALIWLYLIVALLEIAIGRSKISISLRVHN